MCVTKKILTEANKNTNNTGSGRFGGVGGADKGGLGGSDNGADGKDTDAKASLSAIDNIEDNSAWGRP